MKKAAGKNASGLFSSIKDYPQSSVGGFHKIYRIFTEKISQNTYFYEIYSIII